MLLKFMRLRGQGAFTTLFSCYNTNPNALDAKKAFKNIAKR
jgi:hypothetical protein